jgi:uncharacterized protein YciI
MPAETHAVALVRAADAWDYQRPMGRQRLIAEHLAYLRDLTGRGEVAIAGPVISFSESPEPGALVGLVLYRTRVNRARVLADGDPTVVAGLVRCQVLPWYAG